MSWLSGVELEQGSPATVTITYVVAGRYGPQHIGVILPVPSEATQLAEEVKRRLDSGIVSVVRRSRLGRKRRNPPRDRSDSRSATD
jgi:hypothetical protein